MKAVPTDTLTDRTLVQATHTLAQVDPVLGTIVARHGVPPMWPIEPGFAGLINIILGQQVSVASARTAWTRLVDRVGRPTPSRLLELDDASLREIGFSRQKAGYARDLAQMICDGQCEVETLASRCDEDVRTALMRIRGIGRWSADIYLVMALQRPDVWPAGDLALITAAREAYRDAPEATEPEIERRAEAWRPWRSVAARILWMAYLRERGRDLV